MNFPAFQRGHAHVADRRGQPQPQVSWQARRHGDGEDRGLLSAASRCRSRTTCSTFTRAAARSTSCRSPRSIVAPSDERQQARREAAMRAFGAPYSMRMLELDSVGLFDSAAEEAGKVLVSTELGGGGTAQRKKCRDRAVRGAARTVCSTRAFSLRKPSRRASPARTTTLLDMPDGTWAIATSEHERLARVCASDLRRYGGRKARSSRESYDATRYGRCAGRISRAPRRPGRGAPLPGPL